MEAEDEEEWSAQFTKGVFAAAVPIASGERHSPSCAH